MVLPALIGVGSAIARVVARATPTAFRVLDRACSALESDVAAGIRAQAGVVETVPGKQEALGEGPATASILAFRVACDVRKALRRR